jgi:hypothetical protein
MRVLFVCQADVPHSQIAAEFYSPYVGGPEVRSAGTGVDGSGEKLDPTPWGVLVQHTAFKKFSTKEIEVLEGPIHAPASALPFHRLAGAPKRLLRGVARSRRPPEHASSLRAAAQHLVALQGRLEIPRGHQMSNAPPA